MGQVVKQVQTDAVRRLGFAPALNLGPGVIEGALRPEPVDQIEVGTADALQHLGVRAQGARRGLSRLSPARQGQFIGLGGVGDPEGHAAGGGAVGRAEISGLAGRLAVDQQIGAALLVAHDVLRRMAVRGDEAQLLDQSLHRRRIRAGELDELETVEADGIFRRDGHGSGSAGHAPRRRTRKDQGRNGSRPPPFPLLLLRMARRRRDCLSKPLVGWTETKVMVLILSKNETGVSRRGRSSAPSTAPG
ncbi:hypothetical protein D3C73_787160 [compost metagenome]